VWVASALTDQFTSSSRARTSALETASDLYWSLWAVLGLNQTHGDPLGVQRRAIALQHKGLTLQCPESARVSPHNQPRLRARGRAGCRQDLCFGRPRMRPRIPGGPRQPRLGLDAAQVVHRRLMHRLGQRPPAETEPTTTLDSTPESTPVTRNEVCMKPGMRHMA
jgi:hypothetical protein